MTLVIDLDAREKEIEGIVFSFQPLNQSAMAKFASISRKKQVNADDLENQDMSEYITDPDFQNLFADLIPAHCEIKKGGFQIKENDELRDGTLIDIMTLDSSAFFRLKMTLISELISGSNLSLEEADSVKK
jgi:hypothetical protein